AVSSGCAAPGAAAESARNPSWVRHPRASSSMNHPILRGRVGHAVMLEKTAVRVWKRLTREDRLAASTAFYEDAGELTGAAAHAIAQARHLRPQAARTLSTEEQARALATVLDPG